MKIGFVGGGKMAEAIIAGLIKSKLALPGEIFASDVSVERQKALTKKYRIHAYTSNAPIPSSAKVIVLAVKPQQMPEVLAELAPAVTRHHVVISIAAGRKLAGIQAVLTRARLIRVMPNIACTVGEGMSAFCAGATATARDRRMVRKLLSCVGRAVELPEDKFDVVTALSGSGPAFFTYLLDQLVKAATREGLDRRVALLLAEQTMLGAARLLLDKDMEPQELIDAVTSHKGTTAAGLAVLDTPATSKILGATLKAAAKRSKELGV